MTMGTGHGPHGGSAEPSGLPSRETLLRWLARVAVLSTHADEAAVISVLADGSLSLVHCTGPRSLQAEQCQVATGVGPAATARARSVTVSVPDLCTDLSYPQLRVRALLGQMHSVTALPIGSHGRVNAVLDLWWEGRRGPTPSEAAAAEHLQHMVDPVLELVEEQDPAYRDPAVGRRLIGWAAVPV